MTAVTTAPWLGERKDQWDREHFPEGTVNEKQMRTLFSVEEKGRMVVDLDLHPAILKLSDEIVEIHTRFGHSRSSTLSEPLYLWLNSNGDMLAAVVEHYEGPIGVHKPGDTFRKWATAYFHSPDTFAKANEVEYEHMWTLGNDGAVNQARQYIKENWINIDNSDAS